MQVSRIESESFTPFAIKLVIQSEAEAKALFAIFNHTDNCGLLPDGTAEKVRNSIGTVYRTSFADDIISNNIMHRNFYLPKRAY